MLPKKGLQQNHEQKYRTIKSGKNSLTGKLRGKRAEKSLDHRVKYSLLPGAEETASCTKDFDVQVWGAEFSSPAPT